MTRTQLLELAKAAGLKVEESIHEPSGHVFSTTIRGPDGAIVSLVDDGTVLRNDARDMAIKTSVIGAARHLGLC